MIRLLFPRKSLDSSFKIIQFQHISNDALSNKHMIINFKKCEDRIDPQLSANCGWVEMKSRGLISGGGDEVLLFTTAFITALGRSSLLTKSLFVGK
jgi:hypothetical protein